MYENKTNIYFDPAQNRAGSFLLICSEKMLSAWHGYLMYVKCNELKIVIVEKSQENVLL